jgi:hypothetical protein
MIALQATFGCVALGVGVLLAVTMRSEGWGPRSVTPMLDVVVFLGLIWLVRGIARYVADYDRQHKTGSPSDRSQH